MDHPGLVGIAEPRAFPRWRLLPLLGLLPALGVIGSLLLRKDTWPVPWLGGFVYLWWFLPGLLALAGCARTLCRWQDTARCWSTFWGLLGLVLLQASHVGLWVNWQRNLRDLNRGVYSSRVEYVHLSEQTQDWPDPTHPRVFELGSGLRLALSPAIWTDSLHRSLPRTTPPALEPYPDAGEAKPLTDLGAQNLIVLLKASALVRFFHPTTAARFNSWGLLIAEGIRRVEDAPTQAELARRVQALLTPYAPQVRVLLPGEAVPVIPIPEAATLLARWRHVGLGHDCSWQWFTGHTKDRSSRLAGIGMAWTTLQHFYPYWDVTSVDWEGALPQALREAALAPTHEAYYEAVQHLAAQLKDGHAYIGDHGAAFMGWPDVDLAVMDGRVVIANRWGLDSGLPQGAELLSINGEPIAKRFAEERAKARGATSQHADAMAADTLLMAPPRQSLQLEVSDLQGKRSIHDVITRRPQSRRDRAAAIRELKPGILLVELDRVDQQAFRKELPRLVAAKGLILDHRGYPGHFDYLRHFRPGTLDGIQMLLPVSRLPNGEGRSYETSRWSLRSEAPFYRGRVVVLAGGPDNLSQSETFLEVIAANHLAPIVGRPTMGTNGNVRDLVLPGNLVFSYTGMKVLKADGSRHHGIGILPTHPVKRTREALAAGRDEDVERALQLIETGT